MSEESKPKGSEPASQEPIFYDLPKAEEAEEVVSVVDMTPALGSGGVDSAGVGPPPLADTEAVEVHLHPVPVTPPLGKKLAMIAMLLSGAGFLSSVGALFVFRDVLGLVSVCILGIAFLLGVASIFMHAGLLRGLLATIFPLFAFGMSIVVALGASVFLVVREAPKIAKEAQNAQLEGIDEAKRVAVVAREKNSMPLPPRPVGASGPPKISVPVVPLAIVPSVVPFSPPGVDPSGFGGSADQVPLPRFDAGESSLPLDSADLLPPEQRKIPVVGNDVVILWTLLEKGFLSGASQYDRDQASRVASACGYSLAVFSEMSSAQRLYILKLVVSAIGGVSPSVSTGVLTPSPVEVAPPE